MNVVSVIIVAIIAYITYRCIRSFVKDGGENCSACGSKDVCTARVTGEGPCPAADDMLKRVDAAFEAKDKQARA